MLPVIIPVALAALTGATYYKTKKSMDVGQKNMTPERRQVYDSALKTLKDPVKLRLLADAFEKEGFLAAATMLRKRAALRELPNEVKSERRSLFKKAMASTNPETVRELAAAFEGEGATGAAETLRKYADTIPKQGK